MDSEANITELLEKGGFTEPVVKPIINMHIYKLGESRLEFVVLLS